MAEMKKPGVYIVEKNAFPNSIVEVATAVPAFIGYTEKADNKGKSLHDMPWRITSFAEFHEFFGSGPTPLFSLSGSKAPGSEADVTLDGTGYVLEQLAGKYLLYRSMALFFANGGGPCYIVSIGTYQAEPGDQAIDGSALRRGIDLLEKEAEPTLIVIPDCMLLSAADCINTQEAAITHCGRLRNRFAILDVHSGYLSRKDSSGDPVAAFRNGLGANALDFAAAYYPWLNTSIVMDGEFSYEILDLSSRETLKTLILRENGLSDADTEASDRQGLLALVKQLTNTDAEWMEVEKGKNPPTPEEISAKKKALQGGLMVASPLFQICMKALGKKLNLLPPAAAMAGIYTQVDNDRGVWKAPANVSVNAVVSPAVTLTHADQEDLNVTPDGKSINAIRAFQGLGSLVWGARTLDANNLEMRYVNVRRTLIMLEQSIALGIQAYVFEPNTSSTWVTIEGMIINFLMDIWKRGGLAGASPDQSFGVHVGLGETMTQLDISQGVLRVAVYVALIRPAEFIELRFQQQMQAS